MTDKSKDSSKINVTHVNVRQSISILVAKLIMIEILSVILLISTCTVINCNRIPNLLNITVLIFMLAKLGLTIFVIYQWLNEYYEITSDRILHKKGVIFQTEETYKFKYLTGIRLEQGLLGRLLNFGTISVFHKELEQYYDMYLVHNPLKYYHLILKINPDMDELQKHIRDKIIPEEKDM